jgi:hypothetical protein
MSETVGNFFDRICERANWGDDIRKGLAVTIGESDLQQVKFTSTLDAFRTAVKGEPPQAIVCFVPVRMAQHK